jgi:biopolymer transport protein ExbD
MARLKSSRQSGRKPLAAINVTPLVDVLLILLVILMLAMPLFVKRMPVSLPETSLNAPPVAAKALRVGLGPKHAYYLEDAKTSLNDVVSHVGQGTTVEVYVDAAVSYQELASFTEALYAKSPKDIVLLSR